MLKLFQDAIYNGCIVFVCTPRMFTELLAHNPLILRDMDKIRHVILDNFTLKFNKFRDEYNKIYTWLKRFESIQVIHVQIDPISRFNLNRHCWI